MNGHQHAAGQAIAQAREAAGATLHLDKQSLADAALSVCRGTTDAQRLIASLKDGHAPRDSLFDAAFEVANLRDPERTAAWFRTLQKALERAA